jgi:excisionase family DNA binding protein
MATVLPIVLTLSEVAALLRLPSDVVLAQVELGRLSGHQEGVDWTFRRDDVEAWSDRYDQRKVFLRQAGVFAQDDSIEALQAHIDRQRQENTFA